VRRVVPGEPAPLPATVGLTDLRLAAGPIDLDEQRPVTPSFRQLVLGLGDHARVDRLEAGLFVQLAERAGLDALVPVEMAAGERPAAGAVRAAAQAEEDAVAANDDHADADRLLLRFNVTSVLLPALVSHRPAAQAMNTSHEPAEEARRRPPHEPPFRRELTSVGVGQATWLVPRGGVTVAGQRRIATGRRWLYTGRG
jgi:hypothetical protein